MTEAEIRAQALANRRNLPRPEAARLSRLVCARFAASLTALGHAGRLEGRLVALYRALPGELDPRALEAWFRAHGARLCFPRVTHEGERRMELAEADARADWREGPYGIEEPHSSAPAADPAEVAWVVVPGAAFGGSGERIGMGAGYYDRLLPAAVRALRVALAFDIQLYGRLEQNPWDQPMDWIVTEKREIRLGRLSA